MNKVSIISLGCAKNQVDAETMLYALSKGGFEVVDDPAFADAVIINTCGFLESARAEAVESIIEMGKLKPEGRVKKIIVTGCMSQLLGEEIIKEMPEVDAVLALKGTNDIVDAVTRALNGESFTLPGEPEEFNLGGKRILGNEPYYAYLKIAEGCDNRCAYCLIPEIRGKFRSRDMEALVNEAAYLASIGVKELNVIAQDITRYGEDIYNKPMLPELLKRLCKTEGIEWIRLLYAYPDRVTDELLEVMASEEKIVKYLDLPLQHASKKILSLMNRRGDEQSLLELITKIRKKVDGITLRTTFITGFPGETEEDFEILDNFVAKARFEKLGVFPYSREEGTPAFDFENQVDDEIKEQRAEVIMDRQALISEELTSRFIGKTEDVLVEGYDGYIKMFFGRTRYDAPDVDGKVFFTSNKKPSQGDIVKVKITDTLEYDLCGEEI